MFSLKKLSVVIFLIHILFEKIINWFKTYQWIYILAVSLCLFYDWIIRLWWCTFLCIIGLILLFLLLIRYSSILDHFSKPQLNHFLILGIFAFQKIGLSTLLNISCLLLVCLHYYCLVFFSIYLHWLQEIDYYLLLLEQRVKYLRLTFIVLHEFVKGT